MAASQILVFDFALARILSGEIQLGGASSPEPRIALVLVDDSQALPATFTGSSGECLYSDLTGEFPTADGYTVGGLDLSNTGISLLSGPARAVFDADDVTWTGLALNNIAMGVLVAMDEAGAPLIGRFELNEGGVVNVTGDLTVQWNSDGILVLRRAA